MSKSIRRLLAAATIVIAAVLSFVMAPESARATDTGTITVGGDVATRYDAYQLFSATVVDGASTDQKVATDVTWANDTVRQAVLRVLYDAGFDSSASTAQEAAEWLNADGHMTTALTAKLARAVCNAGAASVSLTASATAELPGGYWLIFADDAIAQGEAGTAPILVLVGGSAVSVKPKAATPKVQKQVLEDGTAAWQKAADATVADDLYWRLSATVPAGLTAYDTYAVRFVDTMSAGLDPSKVASSMRVYVAAGADGNFDAVSTGKDGRAGTEPAKGWTDITAQCSIKVAADGTFTVRTGDLIAALGGADAFAAGARVVAVYNAPLNSGCNHGIAKGNPNEVYLRYPRSPFADQSGDAGFTRTPSDDATAYTWGLSLIKRSSSDDKPLAGAKLRITDDRGRSLTADGMWTTNADAYVVSGEDGRVELNGVDAGVYAVEEVAAPKGHAAFEGERTVAVTADGLDIKQVASAKPKVTVSAESPLRVDAADAGTGLIELSVLNTPSKEASRGFMPSTGDRTLVLVTALAAIGVAAIVAALVIKRGGGRRDK